MHFNGRHAQPRNELLLEAILQNLSASKIVRNKGHYFGGIIILTVSYSFGELHISLMRIIHFSEAFLVYL